jgi:hypothetical protein
MPQSLENRNSDIRRSDVIAEEASVREYESTPNTRRKQNDNDLVFSSEEKNKERANITPSQTISSLGNGDRSTIQKINNAP